MSMSSTGAGVGHEQNGGDTAHTAVRDGTGGTDLSRSTIVGALIGFSVSLVGGIVLVVQVVWRLSSWGIVLRRVLGYP
jgi:hypothetical protein